MFQQKDIFLVALIVIVILMMIIPLPAVLMDVMIALNLSAAIIIMLMAVQLKKPVEFTTFPSLLLVTTLFRLAISISTTRLILVEGNAGKIVETFGEVVVSGNLVVGLVIFLIITVVQFLVITKGADRVAEVGARFTLDGMPGKQMSVDADVRAGNIDNDQAKSRREVLEQETKLFGAMDGAMKFVKGDAIAGLVITAINLIGGIAIGMAQFGYPFSEALELYALMTIGDGLVAQIPALLISVSAGTIVTRVTSPQGLDLGTEIGEQLTANRRTMIIAGGVIALFGFIPGFPTAIFVLLGAGTSAIVYFNFSKEPETEEEKPEASKWDFFLDLNRRACDRAEHDTKVPAGVTIILPRSLTNEAPETFRSKMQVVKANLEKHYGISPGHWRIEMQLGEDVAYSIKIRDERVLSSTILPDTVFVKANASYISALAIPQVKDYGSKEGCIVSSEYTDQLEDAGINYLTNTDEILNSAFFSVSNHLRQFISLADISRTVETVSKQDSSLGEGLKEVASLSLIKAVFQMLADEKIPVHKPVPILESILENATKNPTPFSLLQAVRASIGGRIVNLFTQNSILNVLILSPSFEVEIREGLRESNDQHYLVIDTSAVEDLAAQIMEKSPDGFVPFEHPVLITQQDIRRPVFNAIRQQGIKTPVVSYQELSPNTILYPIGTITPSA